MKKHVLFVGLLLIVSSFGNLFAQNKTLGVGVTIPNPNAALHVESPTGNQGFIMPRLTTAQRTNAAFTSSLASSSSRGLMVYDNDLHEFFVWNDTAWFSLVGLKPIEIKGTADFSLITASVTSGPVNALSGVSSSTDPGSYAVLGQNNFSGPGGVFFSREGTGLMGRTQSNVGGQLAPVGVYGESTGTGSSAGAFRINNTANSFTAVYAETNGTGSAGVFRQINIETSTPAFIVETNGQGSAFNAISSVNSTNSSAGEFIVQNATNPRNAIFATTAGTGTAIYGQTSTGWAAVQAENNGNGSGLFARNYGTGVAVSAETATGWTSIHGNQMGATGSAGVFIVDNTSNNNNSLVAETNGVGAALFANHNGASGNIAIFQNNGTSVARIDKNGMGFFNGGTQNSGADVAEMFDVEGGKELYEPGDVLIISENTDRTVEKSNQANSTKVAGVYATKPGVKLTERSVTESIDDLVPMGVIGVIPTKVCLENGAIKRGDLLVTSSKAGHAMKAIPVVINGVTIYPTGAILGKALENFDGKESGMIKVLVNVK